MSATFSRLIALPLDDLKHASFREELSIVHAEHGCRYYLSMLRRRDYYVTHHDAFDEDLGEFLSTNASPLTRCWRESSYRYEFALPFLRETFHSALGIPRQSSPSKADRALMLLMVHPDWDDEAIINELNTTSKQLARMTMFQLARREQDGTLIETDAASSE